MAERRTLNKSISVSEQVNDCSLLAIVSFTWGIIHADDWGIITGKPRTFHFLVVPMLPADDDAVGRALDELVAQRLVVRYTVSGEPWLWFPNFDKHQQGLHKRTTAHRLPTPADADPGSLSAPELCAQWGSGKAPEPAGTSCSEDTLPGNSGKVPETSGNSLLREVKGSEPKGSEGNQDLAPADADAARPADAAEETSASVPKAPDLPKQTPEQIDQDIAELTATFRNGEEEAVTAFLLMAARHRANRTLQPAKRRTFLQQLRALRDLEEVSADAFMYGLQAAIDNDADNVNYAKKAALGYGTKPRPPQRLVPQRPAQPPMFDHIMRSGDD